MFDFNINNAFLVLALLALNVPFYYSKGLYIKMSDWAIPMAKRGKGPLVLKLAFLVTGVLLTPWIIAYYYNWGLTLVMHTLLIVGCFKHPTYLRILSEVKERNQRVIKNLYLEGEFTNE